jgi:hypothetical protein
MEIDGIILFFYYFKMTVVGAKGIILVIFLSAGG